MDARQAASVKVGDEVESFGVRCYVTGIDTKGVAAPYFRLSPVGDCSPAQRAELRGATSYRLCTTARPMTAEERLRV